TAPDRSAPAVRGEFDQLTGGDSRQSRADVVLDPRYRPVVVVSPAERIKLFYSAACNTVSRATSGSALDYIRSPSGLRIAASSIACNSSGAAMAEPGVPYCGRR